MGGANKAGQVETMRYLLTLNTYRFVTKLFHFAWQVGMCAKLGCYVGSGRGIEIRTRVETTEPLHMVMQWW
jgi:hypothetical protein